MKNLEIEYKVMINKEHYLKLLDFFKNPSKINQINYYYDLKDNKLHDFGLSLRIRHFVDENKYLLTLKEDRLVGKMEYECYVDKLSFDNISDDVEDVFSKYNIKKSNLICLGFLQTFRSEIHLDDCLLCIDHNIYNNLEDYEVECEADDIKKAKKVVKNLLDSLNISYEKSKKSKQGRFKSTLSHN